MVNRYIKIYEDIVPQTGGSIPPADVFDKNNDKPIEPDEVLPPEKMIQPKNYHVKINSNDFKKKDNHLGAIKSY